MNGQTLKLAVAFALGIALTTSCSESNQQPQAQAPSIATMTLQLSEADNETSYPALIKGKTDIAIRPQVTGFITKVCVDEGQKVHKGQPLFIIDQVQFQAAVDNAQAAVNSAATRVKTAQMTADTKRQLLEKNIISAYEYQLADNDLQTARAALAQAQAALVTAKKNLTYTTVTAPSDGVVGVIPNREGSLASPSSAQPLTTISDNSQVYAYFSLTEKDLLDMTDGGSRSLNAAIEAMPPVQLRLANGSIYPKDGKVATVSGIIDNATGSASVRALFDNTSGMLRSGNTGSVIIPVRQEEAIVIPQKATFEIQDKKFVYLLNDSNKISATPITIQAVNDGKTYVVTSGLQPGQRIAVEGVGNILREGMVINPVEASQAPKNEEAAR